MIMDKLRILVADDHDVVRRGLRALLECRPGWQVVGEAANGRDAVKRAAELRPDIVILDVSMPELDGLDASRQIREQTPESELLIFTYHDSPEMVRHALEAGARGYVLKSDASSDLLSGVDTVRQHKFFVSSALQGTLRPERTSRANSTTANGS